MISDADELARGVAGEVATVVMTLEEPLDERLFDSKYDEIAILGKLVTRSDNWWSIGLVLHVQNGALLGAAHARLKPSLPGPPALRGLLAGLIEHVATWPLTIVIDRYHRLLDACANVRVPKPSRHPAGSKRAEPGLNPRSAAFRPRQ